MTDIALPTYSPKDFASDQQVRWCPGCGDYAVLNGVRKAVAKLGIPKENFVFVSGIGCAARFPYYMNTFGLHTLHGRAPAFATGIKLANPDLKVCVVSGDGDLFSIGGNHTIHAMRRDVDLSLLLLNNRIYGLTKGQYSPTSEVGKKTSSTPMGSIDTPINPLALALGAGCGFVARCVDVDLKLFDEVYTRALEHKGCSLVEVYQDCNIFNHGAFFYASQKDSKNENTITLRHGEPMIFGDSSDKGLVIRNGRIERVLISDVDESELMVHDESNLAHAMMLTQLFHPDFPEPMGVIYKRQEHETYERLVEAQVIEAKEKTDQSLEALIRGTSTWTVGS